MVCEEEPEEGEAVLRRREGGNLRIIRAHGWVVQQGKRPKNAYSPPASEREHVAIGSSSNEKCGQSRSGSRS